MKNLRGIMIAYLVSRFTCVGISYELQQGALPEPQVRSDSEIKEL
jgi:hypothetical protein